MISVILVNYRTAMQTLDAVASVKTQQAIDPLEIFVIDNSISDSEDALLRTCLPDDVIHIRNHENTGFAKACNQAFTLSRGEFILLLNPDARLLPLALSRLAKSLKERPHAGAIGPRTYWDEDCQFLMPPSTFPSINSFYKQAISRLHAKLSRYQSLDFREKALQAWTCTTPIPVEALSGGHVLIRREAILKCGGLFDERFFMYWEDTNLMQRLRKSGYQLYIDPMAGCLHFYEHSPAKDQLIGQGWSTYQQKNFQRNIHFQFAQWLNNRLPPVQAPNILPLTPDNEKLTFPIPQELRKAWLLELGTTPQFIPAIGHFGSGPVAVVDTILFKRLRENTYFARLSNPISKPDLIYYWQWQGHST
ncbi:MAG: glycosyltransferase family 2 protein [Nitrosomonas sp.]|nr:glycosyltransferase family 2 protein [Nitrosomonas sp.]